MRKVGRYPLATVALGVALLAGAQAGLAQGVSGPERPHIVLFMADDHTWSDCGPYGAWDVRTPHLAQLARDGMRFDAAFAGSSTCTPSRSALCTGLLPFRNGAHANHSLVRDDLRTLPHRMKELGYRVVLAGKTHIGPRRAFPFEYLPDSNVMPSGKNHVLWTDLNTASVDRLLAEHDRKQPLCLVVCSHSPHVYWPEAKGYQPEDVRMPPDQVDTPETRAARTRYYTDVSWMDRQVGEVRQSLARHGLGERTLFLYTADQGAQFPFGKWNLYDAGIRVPLIAASPGRVKPGSKTGAMVSLVDLLPTFVEAAGGSTGEELDGRTLLPILQGKKSRHRDLIFASHTGDGQMNRSPMRCVRDERYKFILNLRPDTVYKTHIDAGAGVDGKGYWDSWERKAESDPAAAEVIQRYRHRPAEELYDLKDDPWERRNLATELRHKERLVKLRERLKQWRQEQGEDLAKVPLPEDARQGDVPYAR